MSIASPIAARLLLSLAFFTAPKAAPQELRGKVVSITDGDTLTVLDADSVQHKIRLDGIDAPEKDQAFGAVARKALGDKVHEKDVRVVWRRKHRGRIIGEIYLGDRNISREMVADGHAWWYKRYVPKAKDLEDAEAEARKERRGLWGDKSPVPPWEWRKSKKSQSKGTRSQCIRSTTAKPKGAATNA
ncbi:MAG: thermonuclease family protein [Planctomycetaceae bacterium]|nr:thermonuclease family protein [Planctomycetaceae bacterium]